jgi:hypothetical protein
MSNTPRSVKVYVRGKEVLKGSLPAKVLMAVPISK